MDFFGGSGFVPSFLKYDYFSRCYEGKSVYITIAAESDHPYIVSIASSANASSYKICKFATGSTEDSSRNLQVTSKITEKLNFLATHDENDLQIRFPKLEHEARMYVESSGDKKGTRLSNYESPGALSSINKDFDTIDGVVNKFGREIIRQSLTARHGKVIDPNSHSDLFPRIKISSNRSQNSDSVQ